MADDLKQARKQDHNRFNVDHEVKYWAEWCLPLGAKQDAPSGVLDGDVSAARGVGSEA